MQYDESGWAAEVVQPWPADKAWSLLSPDRSGSINEARWAHQARRFFAAELSLKTPKAYPADSWPRADHAVFELAAKNGFAAEVQLCCMPVDHAAEVIAAAHRGVAAIGGAGLDVLVGRTQRVWQVAAAPITGDDRGPLLLTTIVASLLLAPVVPPEEVTIFGVKGARERLTAQGLRA